MLDSIAAFLLKRVELLDIKVSAGERREGGVPLEEEGNGVAHLRAGCGLLAPAEGAPGTSGCLSQWESLSLEGLLA